MKNDCRNAKLHFQMTFSLSSSSCLLKLPTISFIYVAQINTLLENILEFHANVDFFLMNYTIQ